VHSLRADLLEKVGEYAGSVESWKEAILSALAGRDQHAAAHAWVELVWAAAMKGDFAEALANARFAESAILGLGGDLELEAQLASNVAGVRLDQGRYEDAHAAHLASAEKRERALGPDDPRVGTAYLNLGVVLARQERFEESAALMQRAFEIQRRALGARHPIVGHTLFNLASTLADLGSPEARRHGEEALAILTDAYGEEHAYVAGAFHVLSFIARKQDRRAESVELGQRALEIGERTRPAGDRMLAHYRIDLGEALFTAGRYVDAIRVFREAHRALVALNGRSTLAAWALTGLGKSLHAKGGSREAIPILERALAIRRTKGKVAPRRSSSSPAHSSPPASATVRALSPKPPGRPSGPPYRGRGAT
jgi:tetratricopeptide (TPR) repeat protein